MDKIYKTLILEGQVSLTLLETTNIINKAIDYHKLSPLATATLGRSMTAGLFMASTLKNKGDRLSITISGNGVGGKVIVSADSNLKVRGYIENPNCSLPLKENGKLNVAGCVGKGTITIVRNMGLKEPYVGTSEIVSGELAEDFSYYYGVSEQQPTAMALGVKVCNDRCIGGGGIVFQTLPFCSEEAILEIEKLLPEFTDISSKIQEYGIDGVKERYFSGYTFNEYLPEYKCVCSEEYILSMLLALGKEEAYDIIKEIGKVEINCEYCDKKYVYYKEDIDRIFNAK